MGLPQMELVRPKKGHFFIKYCHFFISSVREKLFSREEFTLSNEELGLARAMELEHEWRKESH